MSRIANLAVEVGADITPLTKSFRKASGEVNRFTSKTTKATKLLAASFKVAAAAASTAAAGIGIVAKSALQTAENLQDMANKANTSAESLQALRFAASQNGASARDMDDALTRLTRRMSLFAVDGGGPAKMAIQELGIAVTDASGNLRTSGDVFDEIVAKFGQMENNAQKAALASALFGEDAGPRLVPLLNQGSKGLETYTKRAEDLGLVMDDLAVRQAAEVNAQFRAIGESLRGQVQKVVVDHGKTWKELADLLEETVIPLAGGVVSAFASAAESVNGILKPLRGIGEWFDGLPDPIKRIIASTANGVVNPAGDIANKIKGLAAIGGGSGSIGPGGLMPYAETAPPGIGEGGRFTPPSATVAPGGVGPGPVTSPESRPGMSWGAVLGMPENADELLAEAQQKAQQHQDRLTDIAAGGASRREAITADEFETTGDVTKAGLSNLSTLARTGNKELFEIGKAASIAQGLLSAREAITTAYAAGSKIGGPPVGAAYAATAGAAQFANLAAIKATSFSGGGGRGGAVAAAGGASVSSVASAATTAQSGPAAQQIAVTGISADQLYSGEVVQGLLEKLSDAAGDRGMTLMVQS